jgi:hypothetical protein
MEKIDRLGWATGISFLSYGVRVGVRVNNSEIFEQLVDRFPPGWKPSRSPTVERLYSLVIGGSSTRPNVRRFNILYGNIEKLLRTLDLDEFLEAFESDLKLYVAAGARRRVFVHAGVVGWRGQAILIPGRSFSGKTALCELLRVGATYYSDSMLFWMLKVWCILTLDRFREENGRRLRQTPEMLGGRSAQSLCR